MRWTYTIIVSSTLIIHTLFCGFAYAEGVRDGFQAAKKIESNYFTVLVESGVDLDTLASKIFVPPSIKAIIKKPIPSRNSYGLANQLDTLYLAISELMDIQMTEFNCKLKICKDASGLSAIANKLFGRRIQTGGFYVVAIDTLYVDAENVTINILGHELSHAIQTHYFVVPPPEKIQEILAGYVEYQLRKYTNTLPK